MATISQVQIANMALSHIGRGSIEAMDENSPAAKLATLWYDYSRLQVLEAFDWTFARKRQAMAVHSEAAPLGQWVYRYQYPADCVAARLIENPLGPTADAAPFAIEMDSTGLSKSVLTDVEDAVLIYTWDLQATALFSPFFVETLSHMLAAHIAYPLTGKREIKGEEIQMYNRLILQAPAYNANEGVPQGPRDASWIRGR